MFASLTLTLVIRESAIVIPDVAIINNGDASMVFTVGKDDTAALRPIKVGERLAGKAEIIEGLKEGEEVVVEGHQKIVPGAKVKRSQPAKAAVYQN
jgi:membrane fusion protein (multidrug efflux system)